MSWRKEVRGLRGATTVDVDTTEAITERVVELMRALMERNNLVDSDFVSVLFTATGDLVSMFPATAARQLGFDNVALLCARELDVIGSKPRCIRVLAHVRTKRSSAQLVNVYQHGTETLRDDTPR